MKHALVALLCALSTSTCGGGREPEFRAVSLGEADPESEAASEGPVADEVPIAANPIIDPDSYRSSIRLLPGDLTTSTDGAVPTVAVPTRGLSVDEVAALADRVDLVTWPDRSAIQTTTRYLDEGIETVPYARIVLTPTTPLAAGWYALRIRLEGSEWVAEDVAPRDGAHAISRFRVGSEPILRRLTADLGDGTSPITVDLEFSERVIFTASAALIDVDGVADATCALLEPSELARTDGVLSVRLQCGARTAASVRARFVEPLYAAFSGAELRAADGTPLGIADLAHPAHAERRAMGPSGVEDVVPQRALVHVPDFGLRAGSP